MATLTEPHVCEPDCPMCAGAIPAGLKAECNVALQSVIDEYNAIGRPHTPDVIVAESQRRNPALWARVYTVLGDWE